MSRKPSQIRPGPYPKTDQSEGRAISVLNELLSRQERVKAHITQRDKIPNIDGYIELLDGSLSPIGKLDVQVKHLGWSERARMGYSCDLRFLAYCASSSLPVLLIGVAPDEHTAYWIEINRADARSMIASAKRTRSRKRTVRFIEGNAISSENTRYVADWESIARQHDFKLAFWDELSSQIDSLRVIANSIAGLGSGRSGSMNVDLVQIQDHLDELNGLLEKDFPALRETLFTGAWKIGLAFSDYRENSVSYLYYPIRRGLNDLLIKRITREEFAELQEDRDMYPFSNPVHDDARGSARKYVRQKLAEWLRALLFRFDDSVLCRELIFAVIDTLKTQLGMRQTAQRLNLRRFYSRWRVFLPQWVSYVVHALPRQVLANIVNVSRAYEHIDLNALEFAIAMEQKPGKIRRAVNMAISSERPTDVPFAVGLHNIPLRQIDSIVPGLLSKKFGHAERLYAPFVYNGNEANEPGPQFVSNWWTYDTFLENLRLFFRELPRLYKHVVELNFPSLQHELRYYEDFNLRVMVVTGSAKTGYWLNWCDLKGGDACGIEVYAEEDGVEIPETADEWDWKGACYEVVSVGSRTAMFMFHPLPLLNEIARELETRIERLAILQYKPRGPDAQVRAGRFVRISRRR